MTDQEKCEVVSDLVGSTITMETGQPMFFEIPCPGSYVAYESLFKHTRVTGTLTVEVFPTTCTFTVTATRAEGQPIIVDVLPTDTNRFINLTVDCLKSITFSCHNGGDSAQDCEGEYALQIHWCKCC